MSRSLGLDVHQATIYVTALDLQAGTLEQYEVAVEEKALRSSSRPFVPTIVWHWRPRPTAITSTAACDPGSPAW
jgi:hypothetical protein